MRSSKRFYVDPDIYALEIEKVINRNWFLAGHISELPESGDFKLFRAGEESAIIVRAAMARFGRSRTSADIAVRSCASKIAVMSTSSCARITAGCTTLTAT